MQSTLLTNEQIYLFTKKYFVSSGTQTLATASYRDVLQCRYYRSLIMFSFDDAHSMKLRILSLYIRHHSSYIICTVIWVNIVACYLK